MNRDFFQTRVQNLNRWICHQEKTQSGRVGVALITGTLFSLLSMFLYFPPDFIESPPDRLKDFAAMCANPFARDLLEPILAYRITAPAIAWLLGLRGASGLIVQYGAIVLLLASVYLLLSRRIGSLPAILGVAAVSSSFTVIWPSSYPGYPDSVTHLLIALTLFTTKLPLVTLLCFLAMMNDERAILAWPLIVLWHVYDHPREVRPVLFRLLPAVAVSLVLVIGLRHALTVGWIGPGVQTPALYGQLYAQVILQLSPWGSTWTKFFFSIFMGYRWLWVLPVLVLLWSDNTLQKWFPILLLPYLALGALTAMAVGDVSRSTGYLFPGILLAILWTKRHVTANRQVRIVRAICLGQLITPVFYFVADWSRLHRPVAVEVIRAVTGFDVIHAIVYGCGRC